MTLAVMLMAMGVSCAPQAETTSDRRNGAAHTGAPLPHSALGAYLAGRLAQGDGDTAAAAAYYNAALQRDPDNPELLQRAFTLMVAEGQVQAALPLIARLQAFDSDASIPALVNGLALAHGGKMAEAETAFAALAKRGLPGLVGPLLQAWAMAGQGKTDAALAELALLPKQGKALAPVRAYHAGLMEDLAGRGDAAAASLEEALAGQLSIRGVEAAGSQLQRQGHADKAADLYQRYLSQHPETLLFDGKALLAQGGKVKPAVADAAQGMAEALFDMATLMRQGNGQDAAMVFARLALFMRPNFPLAQVLVADLLSAQGRPDDANAQYGALARDSIAYDYGLLRRAANLEEMGHTDRALDLLGQLSKDRPALIDPVVMEGDILRRQKDFAGAARAYGHAIDMLGADLDAQFWPLLYSRGMCLERLKDWPGAEADFRRALELRPDQPDVLNYLGYTWIDRGVNLAEGRAMIEKAVKLRPRDGAIVDSLGWALYRMGEFQEAVKVLERAIELKAEDPTINDHLGDAYWQVGREAEAMFQWRRAMGLNPEPEQIAPLQEKLRTGKVPAAPLAR